MLGLSAVAVESEMVGKDSEAELIGGEVLLGMEPAPTVWRAACAVWGSALDLGEDEKNWLRRLDLTERALLVDDEGGGSEESLTEGEAEDRRGIAGSDGGVWQGADDAKAPYLHLAAIPAGEGEGGGGDDCFLARVSIVSDAQSNFSGSRYSQSFVQI